MRRYLEGRRHIVDGAVDEEVGHLVGVAVQPVDDDKSAHATQGRHDAGSYGIGLSCLLRSGLVGHGVQHGTDHLDQLRRFLTLHGIAQLVHGHRQPGVLTGLLGLYVHCHASQQQGQHPEFSFHDCYVLLV